MSEPMAAAQTREQLLDEILFAYLQAAEGGRAPDRREWLERYPELAAELNAFFADQDRFDVVAAPLRRVGDAEPRQATTGVDPAAAAGGTFGDFRLLREVGRGGMGLVYEAEQISLRRRVAVKVLPFAAALDPRQLQRFKNESLAAAQLHHTNIVPVYYVGCDHGVHYYAMQFVEGQSLAAIIAGLREVAAPKGKPGPPAPGPSSTPTVDQAEGQVIADAAETAPVQGVLSTARSAGDARWFETVAGLGVQAAEALDHAHQQGVVHRDVKPANLLIDGRGHLWVADFGLAQVQSDAKLTLTGDLVGTLRYMSPEQALAQRVVVDHRTDVYSLGATLYELLTLEPAFSGADRQELLRQIAFEEPRSPRRLNRTVPKELETVVLKALEKDPADRYATAQELADDLRRFLDDKPIRAKRPSLARRAGKWARRNRGLVAASLVLLFVAATGLAVSTILLSRAHAETWGEWKRAEENLVQARAAEAKAKGEQAKAEKEAAKAKAVTRFLTEDLLGQATPYASNADRKVTVEDLLTRAAKKIDGAFPDQPEVEATIRFTLGKVYHSLTLYSDAEPHLRRAVELYRRTVGPENEDTLEATYCLVQELLWQNRWDEAEALSTKHLEACRHSLGQAHWITLLAMGNEAAFLSRRGKRDEALSLHREILEVQIRVHGPCHPDAIRWIWNMIKVLQDPSNLAEAEVLSRWSAEVDRRNYGPDDLHTMNPVHGLAIALQNQGRLDEAEPLMRRVLEVRRRALGAAHADTAHAAHLLADLLKKQDRPAEAEPLYRQALEVYRPRFGPTSPQYTLSAMDGLAFALKDQGKFAEAESLAREAFKASHELAAGGHSGLLVDLGAILSAAGEHDEAERLLRKGLEIRCKLLPPGHAKVANARSLLGGCLAAQKRYAEAESLLLAGYEALQKDEQAPRRWLRDARDRLVQLYESWGKPDKAKEWRAREVPVQDQRALREKWTAAMHKERQKLYRLFREKCPATADQYNRLAWIMATAFDPELRDPQQAVELARKAVELDPSRGECWTTLGAALYRAGEPQAAVETLQKAAQLREHGADSFFLAMAHHQSGDKEKAGRYFRQAAGWMDINKPQDEELRQFRAEAAALLGIKDKPTGKIR